MLLVLLACASTLDDLSAYVDEPRVLAVNVEPAEVSAGERVRFTALYADASGTLSSGELDWSFCTVPRPLAELGSINRSCLDPDSTDLASIGSGLTVETTVPTDACSLFGPNPPPPQEGEAAGRPADPDVTGGYYQPALAFDGKQPTLAPVRVRCGLANVTQETYVAWNSSYLSNTSPLPTLDVPPYSPGETVDLQVSWPECADGACGGAETYVVYDPDNKSLLQRREAISVTWYATGGSFAVARNGRSGDDTETSFTNTWTAPSSGEASIWVVLRDERGGVGFAGTP